MSQFLVSITAEDFLARLRGAPERLNAAIRTTVERLSVQVQALVKRKLGGEVLHVRTGTLRRSINRLITDDSHGVIATVGTNVRYAAIHEYGFDGEVPVKAYSRHTAAGTVANVRAHVRHVVMPKRSFLVSSLDDMGPQIKTDIKAAALEALR
jgi:phage gpG-like protein